MTNERKSDEKWIRSYVNGILMLMPDKVVKMITNNSTYFVGKGTYSQTLVIFLFEKNLDF